MNDELGGDGRAEIERARPYSTVFVITLLLSASAGLTDLRIGSLQLEDLLLLVLLGLCTAKCMDSGYRIRVSSRLRPLFTSYGSLLLLLVVMAVLALRLTFYPLEDQTLLTQPLIYSLSKLLQFSAVICGFLWLTNAFTKRKNLLVLALRTYWYVGVASSLYAVGCYAAVRVFHFGNFDVFGAYFNDSDVIRARGFFNEGGPFGIYLVSVMVIGLLCRQIAGRRLSWVTTAIIFLAFILSSSKAGLCVVALLVFFYIFSVSSVRARIGYLLLALELLFGIGQLVGLGEAIQGYLTAYLSFDEQVASRGRDYNLVVGRVSALYIVPKMIIAHPLTGIGYGNYPFMRNDPNYLDGLPTITEVQDLPALGFPGVAAEIGVPATIWLIILLFVPYNAVRKGGTILAIGTLFQPIAHTFAVQLTFFYPWLITACAFGASFWQRSDGERTSTALELRSS